MYLFTTLKRTVLQYPAGEVFYGKERGSVSGNGRDGKKAEMEKQDGHRGGGTSGLCDRSRKYWQLYQNETEGFHKGNG